MTEDRLSNCRGCDEYRSKTKFCNICGCYMPIKAKFKGAYCPIGKWNREEYDKVQAKRKKMGEANVTC